MNKELNLNNKYLYFIVIFILSFSSNSQEIFVFNILEREVSYKSLEYLLDDFILYRKISKEPFYSDEQYLVRKTCCGEWGGAIWFKNKRTGIEYSCAATCPKSISKYQGKYIVSTSLNHGSGSSSILEIVAPEKMEVFVKPKPRNEIFKPPYYIWEIQPKSQKGVKELWSDYGGVMIYFSFLYKEKLYHIVEKDGKTYIAILNEEKQMKILDKISDKRIWSHYDLIRLGDNHIFQFLGQRSVIKGYIEIIDNNVNLVWYSFPKRMY
ncbi:hypothetical protein [Tenacibaculum sp. M341]|uniref:hypothetical protein n=1 Tax=Tenacibaculum sp. M341 TaxID=2530339 RepID=UPI001043B550|nr:hypothetical protein [Tenacibaculum sp. M341]TCI85110.1 hypothetical protein EYW44_18320 [Tenacibaculum sp. M341]